MIEVEAKVPISPKTYQALKEKLKRKAQYVRTRKSEDTYYDQPKVSYIRIRKGKNKATFDLKLKRTLHGIESNIEMEWGIQDLPKWRAFLKKLGIHPGLKKTKRSELYTLNGFQIELNFVSKLGYFLEIEKIVSNENGTQKAKKELIELFNSLGFSRSDFEKRPYLELLSHV